MITFKRYKNILNRFPGRVTGMPNPSFSLWKGSCPWEAQPQSEEGEMQQKIAKYSSLTCPGTQYTRKDEAQNTWKQCHETDCLGL